MRVCCCRRQTVVFAFLYGLCQAGCDVPYPDNETSTTTTESLATTTTPEGEGSIYTTMVGIPGGIFEMGCSAGDAECAPDESPPHAVTISAFKMSAYEITQHQWAMVMGYNPSMLSGCADCPVETVSWHDAQEFINTLNQQTQRRYRLPTEAEWEYAARAGTATPWPCGGDAGCLDDTAWYYGTLGGHHFRTQPVGRKEPNAWGLYDISGNVWEWCQDWYAADYYLQSPGTDPPGPDAGVLRLMRGGSWASSAQECRSSCRSSMDPAQRSELTGLRLVLEE